MEKSVGIAVWDGHIRKAGLDVLNLRRLFLYSSYDTTKYKNMGFIDTWSADKHLGDIGVLIAFKTSKTKLNFQRNHCG